MITKNNNFRNNLALRFVMGVLLLSTVFISCEKDFDELVFPQDVLSPGEVRNVKVTEQDGSIKLAWTSPIDFDFRKYVISYTPNGVGEIELENNVSEYLFESLKNDTEYTITISTKDIAGNISKGMVIKATPKKPIDALFSFTENFNSSCGSITGLPTGWKSFSASSNTEWQCVDDSGNKVLQGNNYGANIAADDWLITSALNLPFGHRSKLNFKYSTRYSDSAGQGLSVMISTNYDGTSNPSSATWTVLNAGINNALNNQTLVAANQVSLSGYSGKVYVAFRYTSSGNVSGFGAAVQVRVDDVSVAEQPLQNFPLSQDFNASCPGLPSGWTKFSASSNTEWQCVDDSGNKVLQGNNYGADIAADDWLITPGIEIPTSNNAKLNFKYSTRYSDASGQGLAVMISTNYTGDKNTATWTVLNAGINNGLNNQTLIAANQVSLSGYSGIVHVAFRYTSSGNVSGFGAAVQVRVDDVSITNQPLQNYPFSQSFNSSCPNLPSGWTKFSASSNTEWECVDDSGNKVLQGNNYGANIAADDWLITPGIQLPTINNAKLNFKYSTRYSDTSGQGLAVMISTNYTGDKNTATWTVLNAGINNALNNQTLINANQVSLSGYSGTVHVAFRYTSSGNVSGFGAAVQVRVDDVNIQ